MTSTIKTTALLIVLAALAGCGNKGPLVRAEDAPAAAIAPAAAEPAAEPASDEPQANSGTPAARR